MLLKGVFILDLSTWMTMSSSVTIELPVARALLVAQMVKNLPAVQETLIQSLGWQDPLEKGMATHSSILA